MNRERLFRAHPRGPLRLARKYPFGRSFFSLIPVYERWLSVLFRTVYRRTQYTRRRQAETSFDLERAGGDGGSRYKRTQQTGESRNTPAEDNKSCRERIRRSGLSCVPAGCQSGQRETAPDEKKIRIITTLRIRAISSLTTQRDSTMRRPRDLGASTPFTDIAFSVTDHKRSHSSPSPGIMTRAGDGEDLPASNQIPDPPVLRARTTTTPMRRRTASRTSLPRRRCTLAPLYALKRNIGRELTSLQPSVPSRLTFLALAASAQLFIGINTGSVSILPDRR